MDVVDPELRGRFRSRRRQPTSRNEFDERTDLRGVGLPRIIENAIPAINRHVAHSIWIVTWRRRRALRVAESAKPVIGDRVRYGVDDELASPTLLRAEPREIDKMRVGPSAENPEPAPQGRRSYRSRASCRSARRNSFITFQSSVMS
jgi:hypothetical protein